MKPLTYADREEIMRLVEAGGDANGVRDENLVGAVSRMLEAHCQRTGFEYALIRDALSLSYQLLYSDSPEIKRCARSALSYLLKEDDFFPDGMPDIGLQDDHYVLSLAMHEVLEQAGAKPNFSGPTLSAEHEQLVRERLRQFHDRPFGDDCTLKKAANDLIDRLAPIASTGFFGRFSRDLRVLADALAGDGEPEDRRWARAGLSYIADDDDAIPNDLGLCGFLDDRAAVAHARRAIDPSHRSLLSTLDSAVARWPFLAWVVLNDGTHRSELSEFLLTNCAVMQEQISEDAVSKQRCLVLPSSRDVPFWLALLGTIGTIANMAAGTPETCSLQPGDHVYVDGGAIRTFRGFREINGQRYLRLETQFRRKGQKLTRIDNWPATPESLARLQPAGDDQKPRGEIRFARERSTAEISPLDRLLHPADPIQLHNVSQRVVLVSPVGRARELVDGVSLFGRRIRDIIPIGQFGDEGGRSWGSRWQTVDPILVITPDLTAACDALSDGYAERCACLVTGRPESWPERAAELRTLKSSGVPILGVTGESADEAITTMLDVGFEAVSWLERELMDVVWRPTSQSGRLLHHDERQAHRAITAKVSVQPADSAHAEEAFAALCRLRELVPSSQSREPLEQLLASAWNAFSQLAEWPLPLTPGIGPEVNGRLVVSRLADAQNGQFLTADEQHALMSVAGTLDALRTAILEDNPKYRGLRDIQEREPGCSLAIVGRRQTSVRTMQSALAQSAAGRAAVAAVTPASAAALPSEAIVVIPGWFNRRIMRTLLYPPVADDLRLLMYPFEARALQQMRQAERRRVQRSCIRSITGVVSAAPDDASGRELERSATDALEEQAAEVWRRRLVQQAHAVDIEAAVEARLIVFSDNWYGWLTEGYTARRVTHLVQGAFDDPEQVSIDLANRDDLIEGDYLLFHRGSDSDAIRVVADELLAKRGMGDRRSRASGWQRALQQFAGANRLSAADVAQRLREYDCARHPTTIREWLQNDDLIGPRAHADVDAIAALVNDPELMDQLPTCIQAIREVRGAHLEAAHQLARRFLDMYAKYAALADPDSLAGAVELDDSFILVRVVSIDRCDVSVRKSMANRLLEGADDVADAS